MSLNVLIVEDEPIPSAYLQSIIEECEGFNVVGITTNAQDTIDFLRTIKVDIVCMDIMLEGSEDGSQLALRIKDKYSDISILFLTAYSEEEMIEYAIEAEAFAYLLKPYRANEIKATLKLLKSKLNTKTETNLTPTVIKLIDDYSYDTQKDVLLHHNQEVQIGKKEIEFLGLLCKNGDITLSSEVISQELNTTDSSLRSIIYRIRKVTNKDLIISVKRYGYKIATA